ncbi:MAG: RNA polymerase sigma factor [Eubacterium sp.]|nr:RNA polymerase sigma factor [Eubacterium sp.]
MQTDYELYTEYLHGDTSSYDELMIRYGDSITTYLYGYLHNWQDSEDLMIEAFARIMVKKPSIREDGFKAYLYKTARNLASRHHSSSKKNDMFSLDDIEDDISDGKLTEEMLIKEEHQDILKKCLDRIDPKQKEALWLVYYEGLSYAEAADVMKVNKKKIDKLLQTGKIKIRDELQKEGITNAHE